MRYLRKMSLFWRVLKDLRLQDLSARKYLWEMMQTVGLPKRLKENNQRGTEKTLGSRWGVLTSVRDVCALGRTIWYTIQNE